MSKHIYIVRHGETDYNRKGIIQGRGVDTSINELGRRQAQALYDHYSHLPFERVMTSTLQRTHQTVAPFIEQGLPWQQLPEIDEIDWGVHEGKRPSPEMHADYKRIITAWSNNELHVSTPDGESAIDMGRRLTTFVEMIRRQPEQLILVCSHGRAMRALMCVLKKQPLSKMSDYGHANTCVYQVQQTTNGFDFVLENDLSHLERL